jgi:hypothetical protein
VFALGDIHHRSAELYGDRFIVQGRRHNVEMLEGIVRRLQAILTVKILLIPSGGRQQGMWRKAWGLRAVETFGSHAGEPGDPDGVQSNTE